MSDEDNYSDTSLLKRSVDSLLTDQDEVRIGFFVANEYESIVKSICTESRPEKCILLAERIQSAINTVDDKNDNIPRYRAMLKVSRCGLNAFYDMYLNPVTEKLNDDLNLLSIASNLHYYCAIGAQNTNRPFDALEHINRSLRYNIHLRKCIEQSNKIKIEPKEYTLVNYALMTLIETKIFADILDHVDEESKRKIAFYIYYSQIAVSNTLAEEGQDLESKQILKRSREFKSKMLKENIDLDDRDYYEILFSPNQPDDRTYKGWCWSNVFCINPLNELPVLDDLDFSDHFELQTDEVNRIRLNDILRTFDHCRRILFDFQQLPYKDRYDCKKEPVQSLLDSYFRIFSTLDKLAKVISSLALGIVPREKNDFKTIAEQLRFNTNDYLRGIYEIQKDIFYDWEDIELGFTDPFYSMHRVQLRPNKIRNRIVHDAVMIVNIEDKYEIYDGILTISARDLEVEIQKLLWQVREILMNVQLASKTLVLE
jgi:hypothetical protein